MHLEDEVTASIDPGDDFYNFINRKWRDANPIPADKSNYSALTELSDTVTDQLRQLLEAPVVKGEPHNCHLAKKLYAAGMDEAAIEAKGLCPVAPFISEIESIATVADIQALIAKRHSEGRELVWRLSYDVDEKDSRRYVMTVSQGGLLLPDRDYYLEKGERFEAARAAYEVFLTQFFALLGKDDAAKRAANVYKIEKGLALASNTAIEDRDVEALYNPFLFEELAAKFSGFDWRMYRKTTGLTKLDGLIVRQLKFMEAAIDELGRHGIGAWQDYLIAQSVVAYLPLLTREADALHFSFFGTVLTGAERPEARYKRVVRSVVALLPEPVGQLYTEAYFDESAKAVITDLVTHIQAALRVRLKKLEWMSGATKQKALAKLDTFMPLLGYPDKWRSYASLELGTDYVQGVLAVRRFDWRYDVQRVARPVDRKEWLMSPATVNAYYWASTNGITFPAAILQPPAFDASGDFAANYGAIGMVIGHELLHGFDDNGSKYDAIGNLHSWWTTADRKAFERRTKQLVSQYDSYEVDGQHVKGELTLGENIADLGGMLIAYDALKLRLEETGHTERIDGFTPEQRFFMAQARIWRTNIRPELALQFLVMDPHAPAHLRVNAVVANVDAWYEAWGIREGARLYRPPAERVRIW